MDFSNPLIAYFAVFIAGILSSASPCVLPVIPLIIGFVGGYSEGDVKQSVLYSICFAFGLAITFTILGAVASVAGALMGDIGGYWKYVLSAVAIIMGLQMTGILNFNIPTPGWEIRKTGLIGAIILGMVFGLASSPCATPVLAVILTFVASKRSLFYGLSLLFVYALAHTFLIIAAGVSTGFVENLLKSQRFQNFSAYSHKISGLILIVTGIALLLYIR